MKNYYDGYRTDIFELLHKNQISKKLKILEIGAGNGEFSKNFPKEVEYWIVEPDLKSAISARKKHKNVLNAYYDDIKAQLPNDYFDLIICNDVIEHMQNWKNFLKDIQDKINKNRKGKIIGSIPNFRHFTVLYEILCKKDFKYRESGILDKTHVVFFTEKSLKRELINSGFEVETLKLMKKFRLTKDQNIFKYIISKLVIYILGADSAYGQFGFVCSIKEIDDEK